MRLARFIEGNEAVTGLVVNDQIHVYGELGSDPFGEYLLLHEVDETSLKSFIEMLIGGRNPRVYELEWVESRFIMPMIPSEVWAAGVTYKRSVDAREEETETKGIYDMVYESERPEIILKGLGY